MPLKLQEFKDQNDIFELAEFVCEECDEFFLSRSNRNTLKCPYCGGKCKANAVFEIEDIILKNIR